jgi:dTDP-4-amino-4,6-dideoxygalactose transaminase
VSVAALRPAGRAIPARPGVAVNLAERLGRDVAWLDSGTSALALAIRLAMAETGASRVLVPAYGCPDLLAAVLHAGAVPVLLDTRPGTPFLDAADVRGAGHDVAAVLGVHLLGMPEDLEALDSACVAIGAVLVEDSAQLVPVHGDEHPKAALAVYSFGRGKPAGALGGGALAYTAAWRGRVPGDFSELRRRVGGATRIAARRAGYNALIRPLPYGLVSRLPGTGLGETRYVPLRAIGPMDAALAPVIAAVLAHAPAAATDAQLALADALQSLTGRVDDLGARCGEGRPLPRYPILMAARASRDAALVELRRAGLGATPMYGRVLPELPGVPPLSVGALPNAGSFADRLLTLPVHEDVGPRHVERMVAILGRHA